MDTQTLVAVLTWALVTVAGGLIASLVWFALRTVAQLDRLSKLLSETSHGLDKRLSTLEMFAEMRGFKQRRPPTEETSS